jgi:tetratricopeptide (TPR) repeat protein
MKQLIDEGKIDKAKKIIELAMTKMPLDKFGYYSLVEPFAKGYYDVGEKAKAHDLLEKLTKKYQENLNYYAKLIPSEQSDVSIEIITDLERYRSLLTVMQEAKDIEYYNSSKKTFNTYIEIFARFGRKKE